jgi:hypothetical protein
MPNDTHTTLSLVTHQLDPALVERELATFHTVLKSPITAAGLDHWVKDGVIRADILSNTVWGMIRWRKALGRPNTVTLASAFVIERTCWQTELVFEKGALREKTFLVPLREPSKWDGPDDEDYYRVSFMADTPQLTTRVRVDFAPLTAWEHGIQMIAGFRDIEPSGAGFVKGSQRVVLDPFEVVRKSYSPGNLRSGHFQEP